MNNVANKREKNKAGRRAAIIEVATRSFLEKGYASTTMSAIADEMGGSKATLWAHFPSKVELFTAVVDSRVKVFADGLNEILVSQVFSFADFRRFCLLLCQRLLDDEAVRLYRLIVGEGERFPEIVKVFYSRGPERLYDYLRDFFETRFLADDAAELVAAS